MKYISKALIVLTFLIVLCTTGCDLISPPQDGLRKFFNAVNMRDYETAKLHATGKMAEGYILGETLATWCALDDDSTLIIKILNVDINDRETVVVFKLFIYGEGDVESEVNLRALLVKRKGKWLVDDIYS